MQVIRDVERLFVVDYAHTPDALTQVLVTLKRHVRISFGPYSVVVVIATVANVR